MKAWKIAAGISCYLGLAAGCCSSCLHPYLDCGPVWSRGACQNCNPDYRAGSILNRPGSSGMPAQVASRTAAPIPPDSPLTLRSAQPARSAVNRTAGSEHRDAAAPIIQPRPIRKAAPEGQVRLATPQTSDVPKAPLPTDSLPPRTVPAPPGTKEGDSRILSVTDRRLDELQKTPPPLAAAPKTPQRVAEKPDRDFGGWHPAVN